MSDIRTTEDKMNAEAFADAISFLYNSQHTDLGFSKERAIRAAIHANALLSRLETAEKRAQVAEAVCHAASVLWYHGVSSDQENRDQILALSDALNRWETAREAVKEADSE